MLCSMMLFLCIPCVLLYSVYETKVMIMMMIGWQITFLLLKILRFRFCTLMLQNALFPKSVTTELKSNGATKMHYPDLVMWTADVALVNRRLIGGTKTASSLLMCGSSRFRLRPYFARV